MNTTRKPDFERLKKVLLRQGEPDKVPFYELFADTEIMEAVTGEPMVKYAQTNTREAREKYLKAQIKFYYELGYDYVYLGSPIGFELTKNISTEDTAELSRSQRGWVDEHHGIIENWQDLEKYRWPDVSQASWIDAEFMAKNIPDGMKIIFCGPGGVLENVTFLTGFENLSLMLADDPELVKTISEKVGSTLCKIFESAANIKNLGALEVGDDMGFKTSTMISPKAMREYIFPWEKKIVEVAHKNNFPFILHACGQLKGIMDDLIDDVKIDAKHSYEDIITPVAEAKKIYGKRIAILGGVDMDYLCRHTEEEVRKYTRNILEVCAPGGGYALGTGNTVANYVPVKNYLAMLDEGRKF